MSKKKWVTEQFCQISELVGRVKFKHEYAYDCFCGKNNFENRDYRYDEEVLRFIAEAVNEKIERGVK